MISIFIFYSPDRINALNATISCLKEMEFYEKCQKTLIVDEKTSFIPDDFGLVVVPRIKGKFNWARMWDAGVYTSQYPILLYLDCDRLLPNNFLSSILDNIDKNRFLFTSRHFMMLKELSIEECKAFLRKSPEEFFSDLHYFGKLKFEVRFKEPCNGPGKNVMSGSTAFLKETYQKVGGVDPWYCGHGAFADTDFHIAAAKKGCEFIDLALTEIHYIHDKKQNEKTLTERELGLLSLDNYIYYCKKWGFPMVLAEDLAHKIGVEKPEEYVKIKYFS